MDKHLIAVLPGDGIGPEVIAQATRLLEHLRDDRGLPLELWHLKAVRKCTLKGAAGKGTWETTDKASGWGSPAASGSLANNSPTCREPEAGSTKSER